MRKSLLTLALVVGVTMLLEAQSKAGIFIGLPLPLPVPVFYGPRPQGSRPVFREDQGTVDAHLL
jgi:hypothetical protein